MTLHLCYHHRCHSEKQLDPTEILSGPITVLDVDVTVHLLAHSQDFSAGARNISLYVSPHRALRNLRSYTIAAVQKYKSDFRVRGFTKPWTMV